MVWPNIIFINYQIYLSLPTHSKICVWNENWWFYEVHFSTLKLNFNDSKYFGTCLCTSSQRNSPSLCCKVVVYSVNYNFCLNQISLNQFWNKISIISISYSCTCMWFQKEFTLLYGQFLTVRCELYQICAKKSWSEFN